MPTIKIWSHIFYLHVLSYNLILYFNVFSNTLSITIYYFISCCQSLFSYKIFWCEQYNSSMFLIPRNSYLSTSCNRSLVNRFESMSSFNRISTWKWLQWNFFNKSLKVIVSASLHFQNWAFLARFCFLSNNGKMHYVFNFDKVSRFVIDISRWYLL